MNLDSPTEETATLASIAAAKVQQQQQQHNENLSIDSTCKLLLNCCSSNVSEVERVLLHELTLPADKAARKIVYSVLHEFFTTHPSAQLRQVSRPAGRQAGK